MRLTVVGSGTSQPQIETPASGLLVESASTAILVDCGQGIVRELLRIHDPRELDAIVIGHMHADHYIDLVALRYLLPWEGVAGHHVPVLLPPGGRERLTSLAAGISERPTFFDDAFEVIEYDPAGRLHVGDLTIEFIEGRHYVPAWGCTIRDSTGTKLVISGDTGPSERLVEAAHEADLLVVEATLASVAHDDPRRGHLTPDEALDIGTRSGARRTILVHYRTEMLDGIVHACTIQGRAAPGRPGLVVDLADPAWAEDPALFETDPGVLDGQAPGIAPASSASPAR